MWFPESSIWILKSPRVLKLACWLKILPTKLQTSILEALEGLRLSGWLFTGGAIDLSGMQTTHGVAKQRGMVIITHAPVYSTSFVF